MSEAIVTAAPRQANHWHAPVSAALPADVGLPELNMVRPLPGFPDLNRFALVRIDHAENATDATSHPEGELSDDVDGMGDPVASLLFELRSLQAPDVRFLVAAPAVFFPHYTPELDGSAVAELGLERAEDALVLVILTVGTDSASSTANLLAPVVINARNRSAAQVILSGSDWPVRATVA